VPVREFINFALSPCPNDVFIIAGIILKKVSTQVNWNFCFADIETLNNWAIERRFEVIKCSFGVWKEIHEDYILLPVGSAMGFGSGPLLVGNELFNSSDFPKLKVGIPGEHTTAHLLFKYFYPGKTKKVFLIYDEVIPKLLKGEIDMGILIHEGRFLYEKYGLKLIADLGEVWERGTGSPVPLGGFFAKKNLSEDTLRTLVSDLERSLKWSWENFDEVLPLLKKFARELEEGVIRAHVKTFVNRFTESLNSEEAKRALKVVKGLLGIKKDLKDLVWGIEK